MSIWPGTVFMVKSDWKHATWLQDGESHLVRTGCWDRVQKRRNLKRLLKHGFGHFLHFLKCPRPWLSVGGVRIWDDTEPDMRFGGVNDLSFLHAGYETLVLSLNKLLYKPLVLPWVMMPPFSQAEGLYATTVTGKSPCGSFTSDLRETIASQASAKILTKIHALP